ncbi:STAS-like domain-containing protein [Rhizobium leguminosarum]|uniref:STAS-like domain-containing protein n=1 Tax=Rhizobium leguminosarum TaxID=384 RepID=UPI003F9D9FE8
MAEKIINVAKEFSRVPGGRYYTDGPASGQEFREKFLVPAFENYDEVLIELDGTRGYPSSFLDEAFGGLVRTLHLTPAQFKAKIKLKASAEFNIYVQDIMTYVDQTAHA